MKISVLLAVYNGEKYLRECIDSIINQTYENWELIFVNDGSTDETVQIINEYRDSRILKIDQPNKGLAFSLNRAADVATGVVLVRQDADDISEPNRFAVIAEAFGACINCQVFASSAFVVDANGSLLYEKKISKSKQDAIREIITLSNPFIHGSLAFRASAFKEVCGYDISYKVSQDFDLMVRMLAIYDLTVNRDSLYKLRLHSNSVTARKSWIKILYLKRKIYTIKLNLKKNVSVHIIAKSIFYNLINLLFVSNINRKSMYFYQIGGIFDNCGRKLDAIQYYDLALRHSRFNIFAIIKKRKLLAYRY